MTLKSAIWLTVAAHILAGAIMSLTHGVPAIDAWEKANGYPYGKMCNSIFTGYVDTCPKGGVR